MAVESLQVGIPGGPELIILLVILGFLGFIGLIGMYLFNHFIRGYNEAAGYSEE